MVKEPSKRVVEDSASLAYDAEKAEKKRLHKQRKADKRFYQKERSSMRPTLYRGEAAGQESFHDGPDC